MAAPTPNTSPLYANGTNVPLNTGTFAFPPGTNIDFPEQYPNQLPDTPNYIQPDSIYATNPVIPLNFGFVSIRGIYDEDSVYPFQIVGTVSYENCGNAVALDFGVPNAVRLAQPNDIIVGRLAQPEFRNSYGQPGLVVGAIQTKGGLPLPIDTTNVPAPGSPGSASLSTTTGGSLPAETVFVKVTYVPANGGETAASGEASIAVTADEAVVVASPAAVAGVDSYNVYASTATGTEVLQNAEPLPIGTNAVLNTLVTGTAAAPSASTATAVVAAPVTVGNSVMGGFVPGTVQGLPAAFNRTNVVTETFTDSAGQLFATVLFL